MVAQSAFFRRPESEPMPLGLCRVHIEPSGHPVTARLATVGRAAGEVLRTDQQRHEVDDERERYIAHRWRRMQ